MRNNQLIDLEEIVEQALLTANFNAAAAAHDQLRSGFCGPLALTLINESW
jgi:hypothetical protein